MTDERKKAIEEEEREARRRIEEFRRRAGKIEDYPVREKFSGERIVTRGPIDDADIKRALKDAKWKQKIAAAYKELAEKRLELSKELADLEEERALLAEIEAAFLTAKAEGVAKITIEDDTYTIKLEG